MAKMFGLVFVRGTSWDANYRACLSYQHRCARELLWLRRPRYLATMEDDGPWLMGRGVVGFARSECTLTAKMPQLLRSQNGGRLSRAMDTS
jgi:hypothetical protein